MTLLTYWLCAAAFVGIVYCLVNYKKKAELEIDEMWEVILIEMLEQAEAEEISETFFINCDGRLVKLDEHEKKLSGN
jgi:hypothetical protein